MDVITGGSPCQDLSIAGKRAGLAGERSGLFMEQIRVIKEMREADAKRGRTNDAIRPRYMVWENVKGAFSSNGGKDFAAVLEETIRIAEPNAPAVPEPEGGGGHGADASTMKWEDGALLGEFTMRSFGVSPSVENVSRLSQILEECPHPKYNLSARACVGVLRRAKRRGKKLPEVLEAALKLQICRELSQRAAERWKKPAPFLMRYAAKIRVELFNEPLHTYCLQGNGIDRADTAGCNGKGWTEDVSYTLNTIDRPAVVAAFSPTNSALARSIGYREEQSPALKAEVNGNNPPAVLAVTASGIQCGNPWDPQSERVFCGDGAWHSLSSNSGGGQSRDAVLVFDARGNGDGETVPTITGDHENRITDYTALCIGNGQMNNISMAEQSNTLDTMHDQQAILCFRNTGRGWWNQSDIGATLRTPCGGDSTKANLIAAVDCRNGTENPTTNGTLQAKPNGGFSMNLNNVVRVRMNVRRLTPLECDRLQGYPSGWTDIGEWTDSKGKKHDTSDSNRYKADGNSIALPFWFWLLRRISAQYERPATLGSLFDGIGGFPLCWARVNGVESCRWASEIEEFPMAVTRKHFGDEDAGIKGDIADYLCKM